MEGVWQCGLCGDCSVSMPEGRDYCTADCDEASFSRFFSHYPLLSIYFPFAILHPTTYLFLRFAASHS